MPHPIHKEQARLAALHRYEILDTEREPAYDDLTRLAATVCGTPIAMVSFTDADRHWFKSAVGMERLQAPREATFCEHTLAGETGLYVVEDTFRYPGTAAMGALWGPPARFYAGAPLVTKDGYALGSLCVCDTVPRQLSPEQREALLGLARQVMTHLELRRNARELADTVAELRAAEKTIRYLAYHDALTGLPGRLLFHDRLSHALAHAQRCDEVVAVMFLDLDGFKVVNDTWGHGAGDRLLAAVAGRLRDAVRKSDTVARIGGDEFALICPDIRGEDGAERIVRKLHRCFEEPFVVEGRDTAVTASIGIALYPQDGTTADGLVSDADRAMYRAKRHGRNTHAFCVLASTKSCMRSAA